MKRFTARLIAITLAASALLLQSCAPLPAKPEPSIAALASRIQKHIAQPRFSAAQWGIKIVSLDTGRIVFAHNADKYFIPASNTKLYTGALALDTFAPDRRILTTLYATAPIDPAGVIQGDLVLYGQGDPTLGAAEETHAVQHPFDGWAAQLAKKGLKQVRGNLIIDNRYYATQPIGSGWGAGDLQWRYGAEVSALTLNENTFTLTVKPAPVTDQPCEITVDAPWITNSAAGAVSSPVKIINRTFTTAVGAGGIGLYRKPGSDTLYVFGSLAPNDAPQQSALALPNPAETIGRALRAALEKSHISVNGKLRIVHWLDPELPSIPDHSILLTQLASPPLAELLQQAFKRSQNLYAQAIWLQIGRRTAEITAMDACAKEGLPCTTEQWGTYALNNFLPQAGIAPNQIQMREGSGLSRKNLATPTATVALLKYMSRHPAAQVFKDALPIAGVDGTLDDRMQGTAAQNNARAKTGTMQYTYTLSGYVRTAAQEHLAFSIMLNNYAPPKADPNAPPIPSPTDDIDAIVIQLAEFLGHS